MTIRVARDAAAPGRIAKASDREAAELLQRIAERLRPTVRRQFMEAVERIRESVTWDDIARDIEQGRVNTAIEKVMRAIESDQFASLRQSIQQQVIDAAQEAAAQILLSPEILDISFDVTNPRTIEFMRAYDLGLIRQLTDSQRKAIESALTSALEAGRNPIDTARDIRQTIGLTSRQEQAVRNYRRMLEGGEIEALTRELRDRRFDSTVRRTFAEGKQLTAEQIDRMVERYRERYLKFRSETIARTESIRATQAGNHEMWRQAAADGRIDPERVVRGWVYTADGRAREWHISIPSLNPKGVGLDEPFQSELGPIMYPGDPNAPAANTINCRCTAIYRLRPLGSAPAAG